MALKPYGGLTPGSKRVKYVIRSVSFYIMNMLSIILYMYINIFYTLVL